MGQKNTKNKTTPIQKDIIPNKTFENNIIYTNSSSLKTKNNVVGYWLEYSNINCFLIHSIIQGSFTIEWENVKFITSKIIEMTNRESKLAIHWENSLIEILKKWSEYGPKYYYENKLENKIVFNFNYDEKFDIILTILAKKDTSEPIDFINRINSYRYLSKEYTLICKEKENIRISKNEANKILLIIGNSIYSPNLRRVLSGWKNDRKDNGTEYSINNDFYELVAKVLYDLH